MPIPNTPIVNAGLLYVNGLGISAVGANKLLTMQLGAARDSTNTNDIILDITNPNEVNGFITINGAKVGVNGVDMAPIVLSSFYAVYVIGDSTDYQPTAGLLSLNAIQPSLPEGYDMYRRVGWVLTDASANILRFWQYGSGQGRMYYYDVGITVLTAGTAATFTEVNLGTSVPALSTEALFMYTFVPTAATDFAEFLPFGSTATNGIVQVGGTVAASQTGMVTVPTAPDLSTPPDAAILYRVTGTATLTLVLAGFRDILS